MKMMTGLNGPVEIIIAQESDKNVKRSTVKELILVELSMCRDVKIDKIRLYKIGSDLMDLKDKDEIDLEDSDFEIIKKVLKGETGHSLFMVGSVLKMMDDIEKNG